MKKLDKTLFLEHFTGIGIKFSVVLDKFPTSKYVGQFPLRARDGNFTDFAAEVFYEPNPKTELGHSNYFGVYVNDNGSAYITNAKHVENLILSVYEDRDGNYIYSRFQHDFRSFESKTGKISIDGGWWMPVADSDGKFGMVGRTLWETGPCPKSISVIVRDGNFYEIEEGEVL